MLQSHPPTFHPQMPCFVSPKSKMYSVLDRRSSQIQTVQVSWSRLTDLNNGNPCVPLSHNKGNFIQGLDWQPQTMAGFPSPCFLSAYLSMESEGGDGGEKCFLITVFWLSCTKWEMLNMFWRFTQWTRDACLHWWLPLKARQHGW